MMWVIIGLGILGILIIGAITPDYKYPQEKKRLEENAKRDQELLRLRYENAQLRKAIGMSPQRRVQALPPAPEPEPTRPHKDASTAHPPMSFGEGASTMPIIALAGVATMMSQRRADRRKEEIDANLEKAKRALKIRMEKEEE